MTSDPSKDSTPHDETTMLPVFSTLHGSDRMTVWKQVRSFVLPLIVTIIVPGLMYVLIPGAGPINSLARGVGLILWLLSVVGFWSTEITFILNGQSLFPGDAPTKFLCVGAQRVTRNPMMLFGIFPILFSLGLLLTPWIWIWMVVFIIGMDWHIRKHEEPQLYKSFNEYGKYMHHVPRWGITFHPYHKTVPPTRFKKAG
jgi:protein-S-isoprenylcysteine O-methyltransferase Ste14